MADKSLIYDIFARDRASATFGKVSSSSGALSRNLGRATKTAIGLSSAVAGFVVFREGAQFLKEANAEAQESIKVGKLTTAVIKSTGGAAKVTAKQVGNLANAISLKTGIDDEAIQRGENMLLTFKGIRNEVGAGNKIFDRATHAVTDMAAAMAGGKGGEIDLKAGSIQLGKALNDPIKGITALSDVGVSFTDGQKEQIKTLVESGRTMDAQKIILRELESEFGGAAKAQATLQDKTAVAWANIKESVGLAIQPLIHDLQRFFIKEGVPALQNFAHWVKRDAVPGLRDFADRAKPLAMELLPAMKSAAEGIADAFKAAAPKVESLVKHFNSLPDGVKKAIGVGAVATGLAVKTGAFSALFSAMKGGKAGPLGAASKFPGAKSGVVPVWVTNPGFGGKGPGGGGAAGVAKKKGKIPLTPLATGVAGVEAAAIMSLGGDSNEKSLGPRIKAVTDYQKILMQANADTLDLLNAMGKMPDALGGSRQDDFDKIAGSLEKLDKSSASFIKNNPGVAFSQIKGMAAQAGLSVDDLLKVLPRTAGRLKAIGEEADNGKGKTTSWFDSMARDSEDSGKKVAILRDKVSDVWGVADTAKAKTNGWLDPFKSSLQTATYRTQLLADKIANIHDKDVHIRVFTSAMGGPGRGDIGNAHGTSHWRGGWTKVGEAGPERVLLPRGSRIVPADVSRQMDRRDDRALVDALVQALGSVPLVRLGNAGQSAYMMGADF